MTVQVTTTPPGTTAVYSYDPAAGTVPVVPAGPGLLQFQDVLPDGSPGPIWGPEDITLLAATAEGLRVRLPDGTELILAGVITDFLDGTDKIGLAGGLEFESVAGEAGKASFVSAAAFGGDAGDTALIINDGTGGAAEILAVIQNVAVGDLDGGDIEILP